MRSARIIDVLKREIKRQGLNYKQVADSLKLSEAAVKRMFSQANFSLQRLEELCHILGLDEHELLRRISADSQQLSPTLTLEQEVALSQDTKLMMIFYFLIVGKSHDLIKEEANVNDKDFFSLLKELDRLELLELHSNERVRLKVTQAPKWIVEGPLSTKYGRAALSTFIDSRFLENDEMHEFHTGTLTEESLILINRKLKELMKEFDEAALLDRKLKGVPLKTMWLYSGIRPWDPIGLLKRVNSETPPKKTYD